MKVLIDTHIFLWAITDNAKLKGARKEVYLDKDNELYLSIASIWEMLIKAGLGKLDLPKPAASYIVKQMGKNRVSALTIRLTHMAELEALPPLHKDPFDRMLVAQARAEKMPLLSADPAIHSYDVEIL